MKTKTNIKFMQIAGLSAVCLLLLLSAFLMINNSREKTQNDLPIHYLRGNFSVDVDNPREVVGDADYYFAAKVESVDGTEYRHAVTVETEEGYKEISSPYTNYTISVVRNIKGDLRQDIPIHITKAGGIEKDKKAITLYEQDALLEAGQTYIISAYAQKDGSLLISGPNSSELLAVNEKSGRSYADTYAQYQQYFEEEVVGERQRFSSIYDK